jgi:acyl-coenzyme A synthetase/AMP-(fatty) acid ligase
MPGLISHLHGLDVFAYDQGQAVSAAQYLAAARQMATRLPEQGHVLNLCSNRYHFAVVMGAALLRGHPMLLPSTRTPAMLLQLQQQYAGFYAVIDDAVEVPDIPTLVFDESITAAAAAGASFDIPEIDASQIAAYVFTSGSTGTPIPHAKSWGMLVFNAQAEGERVRQFLPPSQARATFTVTGTVPAQHMYGFESTVLMPMLNAAALDASHPFFPADIGQALNRVPAPRLLVSTPFHLRTLVESKTELPALALLLSATAPLSPQLAQQAEQALGAALFEIYGCTEAGQLATRRTTQTQLWENYSDIEIHPGIGVSGEIFYYAQGSYIEGQIVLGDVLELQSSRTFKLVGRHADMINVAGKRTSLAYLNHQLNSIPGVLDGVFYLPEDDEHDSQTTVQRLSAFVVAPGLSETNLNAALRGQIDPLFMPRPVFFLDQLPRNETGKLPQQILAQLSQTLRTRPHD